LNEKYVYNSRYEYYKINYLRNEYDKINYLRNEYDKINYLRNDMKNMNGEKLIAIYKNVIESKTHRNHLSEQYHNRTDIISDYIPEYFYPLMELTKNIIELIEFLKNEI
jgi:hypothetical protein